MASQVDIVNRALLAIGAQATVSSINPSDGSTEADAASVLFTPTFEMLARTAQWNCLQNQVFLSLLQAAPGTPENVSGTAMPTPAQPWLYGYAVPADYIRAKRILPNLTNTTSAALPTGGAIAGYLFLPGDEAGRYQISLSLDANNNPISILLCNLSQAQLLYTSNQPNPQFWDPGFQAAMVASLAAALVPALSLHMPLMQAQTAIANRMIEAARVQDANEERVSQDHTPDWLRARGCGDTTRSGLPSAYANFLYPGWGGGA